MSDSSKAKSSLLTLNKEHGFDLWQEHMRTLKPWDDLSLVRWLNQTLGQLHERSWRASHPLVAAYRLGAMVAHQRDIWNRRSFSFNPCYKPTSCCRAPSIPFISFEVCSHGIYCSCCGEVLTTLNEFPSTLAVLFRDWWKRYDAHHQIAHWTDDEQKQCEDYPKAFQRAIKLATPLLAELGYRLSPMVLNHFPTVFWEDSDHCLDILPEDLSPSEE